MATNISMSRVKYYYGLGWYVKLKYWIRYVQNTIYSMAKIFNLEYSYYSLYKFISPYPTQQVSSTLYATSEVLY